MCRQVFCCVHQQRAGGMVVETKWCRLRQTVILLWGVRYRIDGPIWHLYPEFFRGRWRLLHQLARELNRPEIEPPPLTSCSMIDQLRAQTGYFEGWPSNLSNSNPKKS